MGNSHTAPVRGRALEMLSEGEPAGQVAQRLGVSEQTVRRWRNSPDPEPDLAATRTRIRELEEEVLVYRRIIDALKEAMPPKGATK
ncbi:helix-turn-helix domain-containing protein [Streptomyces heilongjiangensis]|uniref:Helix-turn-helix domain-containing protein n=1 Tax=Streptomyces heilongjiangensis TaxID=945052 RepID=A0ABW1BAF7_9ACTN